MVTWLIGTGQMAISYDAVLRSLRQKYSVIGRGEGSAKIFYDETGVKPFIGGLELALAKSDTDLPDSAIVSVGIQDLFESTEQLIRAGVKNILIEKPAGLGSHDIKILKSLSQKFEVSTFVAYNRRFYSSVIAARDLCKRDGGIKSFYFDFTEWSHQIVKLDLPVSIKEKWVLANSSHVLDLAFYLGGMPDIINTLTSGFTDWHPTSSIFSGCGVTKKGALFHYGSNWNSAGRWKLEFHTEKNKYIFEPLEKLKIMKKGTTKVEMYPLPNEKYDSDFKPGLYFQTLKFLSKERTEMCSISDHLERVELYEKIAGYDKTSLDVSNNNSSK